jgi:alkanesulfonate monooxygenase SsuD/methylene tetrahydromethanopterin reductase-like flavin-dependent oxidoreductase (luciferase family)
MSALSFHLYLPQMRMSLPAIVDRAVAAEAAGFEGIGFMDHLAPPMAEDHEMWDAMAVAGWVLARTERLQVGHLVLCDAFRHPSVLAREVTTLDHASGGRFELGIGWGSVPSEFGVYGIPTDPAPQRVARLRETLTILRGLWSGEPVDHHGEHFVLRQARQRPVPTRPIPITIGGTGRRTMELVREFAQWWNVPIHQLADLGPRRSEAGDARISVQTTVWLLADESERADATALVARRFGTTAMATRMALGTVPEVAEHFRTLSAEGVERAYVWFADFAPPATLARFAEVIEAVSS